MQRAGAELRGSEATSNVLLKLRFSLINMMLVSVARAVKAGFLCGGSMSESSNQRDTFNGGGEEEASATRIVNAKELLGDQKEIRIAFAGVCYRLRVTRRGRLILTK